MSLRNTSFSIRLKGRFRRFLVQNFAILVLFLRLINLAWNVNFTFIEFLGNSLQFYVMIWNSLLTYSSWRDDHTKLNLWSILFRVIFWRSKRCWKVVRFLAIFLIFTPYILPWQSSFLGIFLRQRRCTICGSRGGSRSSSSWWGSLAGNAKITCRFQRQILQKLRQLLIHNSSLVRIFTLFSHKLWVKESV